MQLVKTLFAVLGSLVLLVVGLLFSVVFLTVAVAIGLALWAWLSWRAARLRRAGGPMAAPRGGTVIEGEVVVVEDEASPRKPALPDRQP
jgi:hypothetical protein